MHYAIYLVDKNYHKICTCYDSMQEKTIIFLLLQKACFDRLQKLVLVKRKTLQGRLLSHAMKDHIVRVANEAEFILNR